MAANGKIDVIDACLLLTQSCLSHLYPGMSVFIVKLNSIQDRNDSLGLILSIIGMILYYSLTQFAMLGGSCKGTYLFLDVHLNQNVLTS